MKSYKDLKVWQKADALALKVYEITASFPKPEQYGLVAQMRRAAVSVPANIVEGFSRQYKKEFIQFLEIAKGSSAELAYYIKFSSKVGYLNGNHADTLDSEVDEVGKMLSGLIRSLKASSHK